MTNATETPVSASLSSTADEDCVIDSDPDRIGANRSVAVTFTLQSACKLGDATTDLELSVAGGPDDAELLSATLVAVIADEPSPEFDDLKAYWYCAGVVLAVVALILLLWSTNTLPPKGRPEDPPPVGPPKPPPARSSRRVFRG